MDIKEYRSSFNVFVVDNSQERQLDLIEVLEAGGYAPKSFDRPNQVISALTGGPPHIVLYSVAEDPSSQIIAADHKFVKTLLDKVPETHIILICPEDTLDYGLAFYERGIYDAIGLPLVGTEQLVNSCDRAILTDYYKYHNEQLQEKLEKVEKPVEPTKEIATGVAFINRWSKKLFSQSCLSEVVPYLCQEICRHTNGREVIYFKYIEAQSMLVAAHRQVGSFEKIRGMGLNLKESGGEFFRDQIYLPASLMGFKKLVNEVFQTKEYCALSYVVDEKVKGVVLVLGESQGLASDDYVKICMSLAEKHGTQLVLSQKIERLQFTDQATDLLIRPKFLDSIRCEISRARRIQSPVSLAVLEVNVVTENQKPITKHDSSLIMKMVANIMTKHCRIYDIFGRLGASQIGMLLPHARREDASVKAERLRRIIESATFSEVIPSVIKVIVSVGVSEYPSLCHDSDDMLLSADEALSYVVESGKNKVCLASVSDTFIPDFLVPNI